jgi:anti-sigma28 factor (negative regulator of flagellin synthesis)
MIQNIGQIGSVSPLNDETRRVGGAVKTPTTAQSTSAMDSLEISKEALRMKDESIGSAESVAASDEMKSQRIKNQIASGFYNSPAVQRAVAMKISSTLLD